MIKYESNFGCDPWPLTLWEAAALTSASQSLRRLQNAGTRSVLVISGPTAFCSYRNKCCNFNYSTTQSTYLHLLSTISIFIGSLQCFCTPQCCTHLSELVGHHVADPPGFIIGRLTESRHHVLLNVIRGEEGGDADTGLYIQETNRILQISCSQWMAYKVYSINGTQFKRYI